MNQHPLRTNSEPQRLQVTEIGEHKLTPELSEGEGGGGENMAKKHIPALSGNEKTCSTELNKFDWYLYVYSNYVCTLNT